MPEAQAVCLDPQGISEVKQTHSQKLTKQQSVYQESMVSATILKKVEHEVRGGSGVKKWQLREGKRKRRVQNGRKEVEEVEEVEKKSSDEPMWERRGAASIIVKIERLGKEDFGI